MNFIKAINFHIEYFITRQLLKETNNLLTYPMLIDLTFNKTFYKDKYSKGIKVRDAMLKRAKIKEIALHRHLNRHLNTNITTETYSRYERLKERYINRKEVLDTFGIDLKQLN